jgi:hypothetical protein
MTVVLLGAFLVGAVVGERGAVGLREWFWALTHNRVVDGPRRIRPRL